MTDALWKQQLAAVHPDRGGDVEQFLAVSQAREAWLKTHRQCGWCAGEFSPRPATAAHREQVYCCGQCAAKAKGQARQKRLLKAGRVVNGS